MLLPKPRLRLSSEQRRAALLDAAAAQLRECGLDAMSMETLKDRAGVSRALVYNYFEGLDDVLLALYTREMSELDARIADASGPEIGFEAKLRAALGAYFEFDEAHAGVFRRLQPWMMRLADAPRFRDGLLMVLMTWPAELGPGSAVAAPVAESLARASLGAIDTLVELWRNGVITRAVAEATAFEYSLAGLRAAAQVAGYAIPRAA